MEILGVLWSEVIMRPMVNSLVLLYALLFSNFGLSIIFFTVIIRLLMIPLTIKQTRQMRAMSALQPRMKAIQAKFGKDPEGRRKSSKATMGLYKEAGVNPIGCLGPMVIQMPIWFGLYRAIFKAVPPTPEGMADLSGLLYSWNPAVSSVPLDSFFLGIDLVGLVQASPAPFNFALPVLVGASMWVQQKMTTHPSTDARQAQTNQMMLWMMPIMFGFFTFQFPAGLAVYILFSNLIGIGITYFISGPGALGTLFGVRDRAAETALATAGGGDAEAPKETPSDGPSTVLSENGGRSDRYRTRRARRKPRRRRNRRR
jgi:YidC/Oxa1 family membrane protein insertase